MLTDAIEGQTLGEGVTISGNTELSLDASLSAEVSDHISAGGATIAGTGNLIISNIKILTDSANKYTKTLVASTDNLTDRIALASASGLTLAKANSVTGDYTVTYEDGYLVFKNIGFQENLVSIVRDNTSSVYILDGVEDIAQDIAEIGEYGDKNRIGSLAGTTLTITGTTSDSAIDGNSKGGITVGADKTLTLENVSNVYGFAGAFVTNSGTLNVTDTNLISSIENNNALNFNSTDTTNTIDGTITGTGTTVVATGKTVFNNTLSQSDFINKGITDISASNLVITNAADNQGTLNLNSGDLASDVYQSTETGITNIVGDVTNSNNHTITQNSVTVSEGSSLTTSADTVISTNA